MPFETLTSEYLSNHMYFTARKDSYRTPAGKVVDPYFVVEMPTSVAAMAITEDGQVILVKQYRHPIGEELIELPGGFIDEGEQPMQAVERELLEETGYKFSSCHYLGTTAANPGVLNNVTHLFIAVGGERTAAQHLDANEEIEIVLKPLDEVREMLRRSEIKQSMHALCMFYAFSFLESHPLNQ